MYKKAHWAHWNLGALVSPVSQKADPESRVPRITEMTIIVIPERDSDEQYRGLISGPRTKRDDLLQSEGL